MLADVAMSSGGLGQGLIFLVLAIIVLSFAWWAINGYVPDPLKKYAVLVVVLLCVLALCNFVLSLGGHAFVHW